MAYIAKVDALRPEMFGAIPDAVFTEGDEANQGWAGTDNTTAIQAALDAARPYQEIDFGGQDFMCGPISTNKPVTLHNGRIIAPLGSTGYHLTLTDFQATVGAWGNHLTGSNLIHFKLDGNARRNDMGGIDCVRCQHFQWEHVEAFSYQREAVRWHDSNRETQVDYLHVRYSGGANYPAIDFQNRTNRDGHNNVELGHVKSIYNAGVSLRIGSDDQGNATRAIHLISPMLHGAEDNSPATFRGPEGVEYASSQFANKTQLQIVNARQVTVFGGRIHASGTSPLIELTDVLPGDTTPTSPLSSLSLYGVSMESTNALPKPIHINGTVSDLAMFGNTMAVAQRIDDVVQDDNLSPADAVRSFGNTWDTEQRFGTHISVATFGGTAYTFDRDDSRLLRRLTSTDPITITIPADAGDSSDIPNGESFTFQPVGVAPSVTIAGASGVSIEATNTTFTTRYELIEVIKTGDDQWTIRTGGT